MYDKNMQVLESMQPCAPVNLTLRERLTEQQRVTEAHLSNIKSALEFMDKNPDFEAFHNIIGKVGY